MIAATKATNAKRIRTAAMRAFLDVISKSMSASATFLNIVQTAKQIAATKPTPTAAANASLKSPPRIARRGVLSDKLFVAHNTVGIYEPPVTEKTEINKNSILSKLNKSQWKNLKFG